MTATSLMRFYRTVQLFFWVNVKQFRNRRASWMCDHCAIAVIRFCDSVDTVHFTPQWKASYDKLASTLNKNLGIPQFNKKSLLYWIKSNSDNIALILRRSCWKESILSFESNSCISSGNKFLLSLVTCSVVVDLEDGGGDGIKPALTQSNTDGGHTLYHAPKWWDNLVGNVFHRQLYLYDQVHCLSLPEDIFSFPLVFFWKTKCFFFWLFIIVSITIKYTAFSSHDDNNLKRNTS